MDLKNPLDTLPVAAMVPLPAAKSFWRFKGLLGMFRVGPSLRMLFRRGMGDCCRLTENSNEIFFSTADQDQIAAMRYMRLSGW